MSGHAGQGQGQVLQNPGVYPVAGAGGSSNHGYMGVVGASPVLRNNSAVLRHNSSLLKHNSALLRNNAAAQEQLSKNTVHVQTGDSAAASPRSPVDPAYHTDHDQLMLMKQLLRKHQNKVAQRASAMSQGASQTPQYQPPNKMGQQPSGLEENSSATSQQQPHAQSQAPKSHAKMVMERQGEWERLEQEWANRPWNPNFFSELVLGTNAGVDGPEKSQPPQSDKASQDGYTKMSGSNN